MKTVTEIVRNGDTYKLVYKVTGEKTVGYSLPAYTGVGMNGKINKSRVNRVTWTATKSTVDTNEEIIDKETAMYLKDQAERGDMIAQISYCNKQNWAILLK